jgi:outer membrane protein assembly factor BamB
MFKKIKKLSNFALVLLLISIISTSITLIPDVTAHTPPWTIPTNAYVSVTPNPVEVGQSATIVMWLDQTPPTSGGIGGPRWHNCKLDIAKPDGTNETIGPFTLRSATASDWVTYTPDQVGTYTIVFSWPGQTLTNNTGEEVQTVGGIPYLGDFFAGSTSTPCKLVVQQDPIAKWVEPALPTEYWQRPINDANRDWSVLASNWLKGSWLVNNFQREGLAPESSHIVWSEPITPGMTGGINDAQWSGIPTNVHDYEDPWSGAIIMDGKIYYNSPNSGMESGAYGYYCRDLYTGELIWYKNGTDNGLNNPYTINTGLGSRTAYGAEQYLGLTQGQLYHYDSANGNGVLSYLWMVSGTTWYMMDASTGNFILKLINVPSGTAVTDQDGSLLRYSYNAATGKLLCWNSSQSIPPSAPFGSGQQQWKLRYGATIDAVNDTTWTTMGVLSSLVGSYDASDIFPRSGYTMNLTVAKNLPPINAILQDDNRVPKMIFGATTLGGLGALGTELGPDQISAYVMTINEHATSYSPYPDKTSTQNTNLGFTTTMLWNKNITMPITGKNYTWSIGGADYDSGIFVISCKQLMQKWGYSLTTGELLWGPTASEGAFNYYGMTQNTYYGKYLLSAGYSGTLYCYDPSDGHLMWTYNATSVGAESPYGENYPITISAVADGKVYLQSTEHSPTKPLWRGSYLRCINITDGTEIWKILDYLGFGSASTSYADDYIVTSSTYDNNIYCIGKGVSAATVTASPEVSAQGSSVLITGMITDISPGTSEYVQTARYPNGVPAIADANMQAWMEYLYMQQPKPTNATGVPIQIFVVDANGNYRSIGTATSDATGFYSLQWKPDVTGKYTVYAMFAGTQSYWPSQATTAFAVDEPAATQAPVATVAPSMADQYFLPMSIGIIIAIIMVGLATVLALKKKP